MHTNLSFVVDGRQTTGVRTLAEMTGWSVLELVGLQPLANGFMNLLPVHICWIAGRARGSLHTTWCSRTGLREPIF